MVISSLHSKVRPHPIFKDPLYRADALAGIAQAITSWPTATQLSACEGSRSLLQKASPQSSSHTAHLACEHLPRYPDECRARLMKRHAGCPAGTAKVILFADALHRPAVLLLRARRRQRLKPLQP